MHTSSKGSLEVEIESNKKNEKLSCSLLLMLASGQIRCVTPYDRN
jgi:hypothetical protein